MADSDSEEVFNEVYGDVRKNLNGRKGKPEPIGKHGSNGKHGKPGKPSNPSKPSKSRRRRNPFSVRLEEKYIEIIKALAWWNRVTHREFVENRIKEHLKEMEAEELSEILNKYREHEN